MPLIFRALELCTGSNLVSADVYSLCSTINLIKEEETSDDSSDDNSEDSSRPSPSAVWGYSFLSVTVISLMSVMGVLVLPFMSKSFYDNLLTAMIGLAVGSLAGNIDISICL